MISIGGAYTWKNLPPYPVREFVKVIFKAKELRYLLPRRPFLLQ